MIQKFEEFLNENEEPILDDLINSLEKLKNGIDNDSSIKRYTGGAHDVNDQIDIFFKNLKHTFNKDKSVSFQKSLIINSITSLKKPGFYGKYKQIIKDLIYNIESFARELDMNVETFSKKDPKRS